MSGTAEQPRHSSATNEIRGGRFNTVGVPTERSKDFRGTMQRLIDQLGPERPKLFADGLPEPFEHFRSVDVGEQLRVDPGRDVVPEQRGFETAQRAGDWQAEPIGRAQTQALQR